MMTMMMKGLCRVLQGGSVSRSSAAVIVGERKKTFQRYASTAISSQHAAGHPDVLYYEDVVTEEEASSLLRDCDKRLANKRYQGSHFDAVIVDYKETEMPFRNWSPESLAVIRRLFAFAFDKAGLPTNTPHLAPHVIDLKPKTGVIYPHVDSLKHGGEIVASLSLVSTRTMRLTEPPKDFQVGTKLDLASDKRDKTEVEYVLRPRTFYILTKSARYDMAHEIFKGDERRVSIVFRDQPKDFMPDWAKEFMSNNNSNAPSSGMTNAAS